jgi:hypothetical protein
MSSKFLILAVVALAGSSVGQAATQITCHDTDTFVPIKITLDDDDTSGPVLKVEGLLSGQAIASLGLLPPSSVTFADRELTLTLPGQPRKAILASDPLVRDYTQFGLTGKAIAQFRHKNEVIQKEVAFEGLEIIKIVTASSGVTYAIDLRLQHSGKHWAYSKHYYARSCR